MKIRLRTFLNNIIVGILPLILVSIIFLITYSHRSHQYILKNMDVSINNLKMFLEEDLEKYRDHSFFLARENYQQSPYQAKNHFSINKNSTFGIRQKIRTIEIFIESNNVFRDMARWRDFIYNIEPQEAAAIWKALNKDQYSKRYITTIPIIKNGILIYRNCSILYQKDTNIKLGFVSLSLPLDISYFQDMQFEDPGAIYFIQTTEDLVFSDPAFQNESIKTKILNSMNEQKPYKLIKLKNKGKYFIRRNTFIPLKTTINGNTQNSWTYLGVLYNEEKLNKQFLSFQKMYRLSMILSIILIALVAVRFSNSLTLPLKDLQNQVKEFERSYQKVSTPLCDIDEITQLQASISRMSEHILVNKKIIEEERNHLRKKQETQLSELDMARNIQNRLLPTKSPLPELNFYFLSMEEVSGDFFEFIEISDEETGIFISDVSGHGVPAAFITTMLKSFTLQNTQHATDPKDFIHRCNNFLFNNIASNFVTAFYGIYNKKEKTFCYCNAGHLEPLIIENGGIYSPFNKKKGPCMGVFSHQDLIDMDLDYQNCILKLNSNSQLLMFTDGFVETVPYDRQETQHGLGEEFGEHQMMQSLMDFLDSEEIYIIPFMLDQLRKYRKAHDFEDDICIFSLYIE